MPAQASGEFRRTPLERSDQRVSWQRADQAFFASGACHILAWACRDAYAEVLIGLEAMRFEGEQRAFHVYATWQGWAFDHSGWNPVPELLAANTAFERRAVESFAIDLGLADFCDAHYSRMPHQYWLDPAPRARHYLERFTPPWEQPRRSRLVEEASRSTSDEVSDRAGGRSGGQVSFPASGKALQDDRAGR